MSVVIFCCTESFSQNDSTWNKSVAARYTYDLLPSTGREFHVTSFEGQLKKGDHTLVPTVTQKSIHSLNGYQLGMAYYRKWKWGYSHLGAFYSPDVIFPRFLLRSNAFFTLKYGFEANLGYNNIAYADGTKLSVINAGVTHYLGSIMSSFNMKVPISGYLFYRFLLRKSLKSDKDFIQLSLSRGQEQEALLISGVQPLSVLSFQFSLHKAIINKTQLQVSFGMTKTDNESGNNQFFNYSLGLKREI